MSLICFNYFNQHWVQSFEAHVSESIRSANGPAARSDAARSRGFSISSHTTWRTAEHATPDEVSGEMHKAGLSRVEQVQWAILETDGKISFVPLQPEYARIKTGESKVA